MFGFGRLGRARHEIRRLLSAAAVAFMLGLQAFSAITIAAEADHHCCGEECPVCFELQQCVANMLLTGSGLEFEPKEAELWRTNYPPEKTSITITGRLKMVKETSYGQTFDIPRLIDCDVAVSTAE